MSSSRLDQTLVERGLAESRNKAQALIMAGRVRVNGQMNIKSDAKIKPEDRVVIEESPETRYVSRGGLKLEGALRHFKLDVKGAVAMDIGASTGGFTDCLLQHGASLVYSVDVGKSQMADKVRTDARVRLVEDMNAKLLNPELFDPKAGLAVIDVSFISIKKVLPSVVSCLEKPFQILALVKPQFESKRGETKKGIVKDVAVRDRVLQEVKEFCQKELSLSLQGEAPSEITGAKGNQEFFLLLKNS